MRNAELLLLLRFFPFASRPSGLTSPVASRSSSLAISLFLLRRPLFSAPSQSCEGWSGLSGGRLGAPGLPSARFIDVSLSSALRAGPVLSWPYSPHDRSPTFATLWPRKTTTLSSPSTVLLPLSFLYPFLDSQTSDGFFDRQEHRRQHLHWYLRRPREDRLRRCFRLWRSSHQARRGAQGLWSRCSGSQKWYVFECRTV